MTYSYADIRGPSAEADGASLGEQIYDVRKLAFNVKDYGAKGDGTTDDATAIQTAITAAAVTGGTILFPPGTYIVGTTITLQSLVHLRGSGYEATIVKLKASANVDVFAGQNFATLTGTNGTGGIYDWSITSLTIDGNKANNTLGTGLKVYGYDFVLRDVRVRNCAAEGIYSEWSTSLAPSATGDSMEAVLMGVKVHDCGTNGIHWNGPHDSQWTSVTVYKNAAVGAWVDANGGGLQCVNCHSWGNAQTYAWRLDQSTFLTGCIGEGASSAQVRLGFGNCTITGGHYFAGGASVPVGIEIASGPTQWRVDTEISSCTTAALKFTSDGGGGTVRATVNQTSGTVISGTPGSTTFLDITGPSFVGVGGGLSDVWMTGLGFKSWNYDPQNIATQTAATSQTAYAIAIPLKAGQSIANIVLDIEVAASGTTPTGFFVGLADSSGTMLAQSSNLTASASLTAQGLNNFALSASYLVQANGLYYVVFFQNGAFSVTQPSFGRGSGRALYNGSGKFLSATAGLAVTAFPANGSPLSAYSGTGALNFFAGVA